MMGLGCVCYGLHFVQYFSMAGFSATFGVLCLSVGHTDFKQIKKSQHLAPALWQYVPEFKQELCH